MKDRDKINIKIEDEKSTMPSDKTKKFKSETIIYDDKGDIIGVQKEWQ